MEKKGVAKEMEGIEKQKEEEGRGGVMASVVLVSGGFGGGLLVWGKQRDGKERKNPRRGERERRRTSIGGNWAG